MTLKHLIPAAVLALATGVASLGAQQTPARPSDDNEAFRFKSGVELINVTTTVSDSSGRFVSGLRKEDFTVYEDDQPVEITHFSSERVPVSLGIVLDATIDHGRLCASGGYRQRQLGATFYRQRHIVGERVVERQWHIVRRDIFRRWKFQRRRKYIGVARWNFRLRARLDNSSCRLSPEC